MINTGIMSLLSQEIVDIQQETVELIEEESIVLFSVFEPKNSQSVQKANEKTRSKSSISITPIVNFPPMDNNAYQERLILLRKENLGSKEYQRAKHKLRRELDPRFNGMFNHYLCYYT